MGARDGKVGVVVVAALALAAGGGFAACRAQPAPEPGAATTTATTSASWFVDRAREAGIRFSYFNGAFGQYLFPEMLPGGVALFDFDNDGDLDIYFTQGRMLVEGPTPAMPPPDTLPLRGRLYRNDLGPQGLRFEDVTDASGVVADDYGMGAATADIDNDGCIDLYLTNLGRNRLFRNNCDGTFTDISKESGAADPGWSVSASFVDFDRDGWLDLYVGNYVEWSIESDKPCTGVTGRRDYCTPKVYVAQPDRLYRNRGGRRFEDVTARALAGGPFGPALGVVSADFNADGWPDIYVANDGTENLLWINQRNGTFRNAGLLSGAALSGDGQPEASMGVDAADFDNDGDEDLYMTHLPAEGNNLYINNGNAMFEDASAAAGVGPQSLGYSGFGTGWFDYDNDGWLDLLMVNGAIEAIKERAADAVFPYDERKLLFRNLGTGRFEDVTARAGAPFSATEVSRGAAFGDIDNDGDTDVVVHNLNGAARLLINEIGNRQHWIGLRLMGVGGRDMLGTVVEIERPLDVARGGPGARTLRRRSHSDGSYASANDPRVLTGLGQSGALPIVRIHWPDGETDERRDLPIDRWTTVRQGER